MFISIAIMILTLDLNRNLLPPGAKGARGEFGHDGERGMFGAKGEPGAEGQAGDDASNGS